MPSPAGSPAATLKLLRRFHRDRRGSAAVEFALIATPFFALLFAIIETSTVFFAGQVLETGLQDSARLLYTHQAQDSGMTAAQFKTDLCTRVSVLMSCSIVDIDVKFYAAGTAITITDPFDAAGNYDNSALTYQTPPSDQPAQRLVTPSPPAAGRQQQEHQQRGSAAIFEVAQHARGPDEIGHQEQAERLRQAVSAIGQGPEQAQGER